MKINNTLRVDKPKPIKPASKIETALSLILLKGREGLTQPEAQKAYYDSCLHSTVSAIQTTHGIQVMREPSSKTNHYGGKPFNRYWIAPGKDRERAQMIIERMASKRGATLVPVTPSEL